MMVSGIPTASGYEERIRFAEMEIVDRGANEIGLTMNAPSGHYINGWDVNVAGVRTTSVKKRLRYHTHAASIFETSREPSNTNYRNISFVSSMVVTEISTSDVGTQILSNYTREYASSFQAKCSFLYRGRTTRTGFCNRAQTTMMLAPSPRTLPRGRPLLSPRKKRAVVVCGAISLAVDTRRTHRNLH
jgi:hypothetical protein